MGNQNNQPSPEGEAKETKKSEEPKKDDILDQVRKAERAVKMHLLMKQLAVLKQLARDVLVAKEKSRLILQDVGVSEEDIKRVIDFLNSSPEVQLSKDDVEELRDKVRNEGKKQRSEIQEKIEKSPMFFTGAGVGGAGLNAFAASSTSTTPAVYWANTSGNVQLASASGDSVKISL